MRGELSQDDRSDQIVVHLTHAELLLLAGSVNEVIEVVEDWEFSARLGADKANARALRSELGDLIAMLPPG
jgi:NTP pyrophosphatase (non-canonical NTP hydrolase)